MSRLDDFHRLRAIETDECVEWVGSRARGYGYVRIDGQQRAVHRLALVLATGIDPDLEAAHGPCHNRACMNVRHLSWKTKSQNQLDRRRDGTLPRLYGERSGVAHLCEADVIEIRRSTGKTQNELAARFGVCQATIHRVLTRVTWQHI